MSTERETLGKRDSATLRHMCYDACENPGALIDAHTVKLRMVKGNAEYCVPKTFRALARQLKGRIASYRKLARKLAAGKPA